MKYGFTFLFVLLVYHNTTSAKYASYYFDPATFQPNATGQYNQDNAIIFAQLSNIVYEKKKNIDYIFKHVIHDPSITYWFYDDKRQSTEYMFVNLHGHLIICFRGSEFPLSRAGWVDWVQSDK